MVNCQDIMVIFILSLADFFRTDADFRNSELKRAIYTSSSGIGSIEDVRINTKLVEIV